MPSPGYRISGKEVEVHDSGSQHHQLCGCCNLQLIQNLVAPSHGPPARVLSPLFFQAKSLLQPKPRGKKHSKTTWSSLFTPSEPRGPLYSPSEPRGPVLYFRTAWPSLTHFRTAWSFPSMAAAPRFKSQCPSSFAAPFLTPHTVSYTCQHPGILPAFLGCHSKSGQVWPHGMEPIISKLSRRPCNQGELLPRPILGGSHSHPPGSKHGHSYLTYV